MCFIILSLILSILTQSLFSLAPPHNLTHTSKSLLWPKKTKKNEVFSKIPPLLEKELSTQPNKPVSYTKKDINEDILNQLPSPLNTLYSLQLKGLLPPNYQAFKILKWGIPLFYGTDLITCLVLFKLYSQYTSGVPAVFLIISTVIFVTFVTLGTLFFSTIYALTQLNQTKYHHYLFKPKPHTPDILYKRIKGSSLDIYLTNKQQKQLHPYFKLSPIGSYTVLNENQKSSLLIAKINPTICLIIRIPPSKADDFFYTQEQLKPYFPPHTVLLPFSIDTNRNLKGELIPHGAGIGFELQGEIFFFQKHTTKTHLEDCPNSLINGRGLTHLPSLLKTDSVPQVGISFDVSYDLELITDPIRYTTPSEQQEAVSVVFHMAQTWKGIEEQITSTKKPFLKVLQKVTEKTNIIYKKSDDPNNLVDPQELFLRLKPRASEPSYRNLQCTYSVLIETLSSPLLSAYDPSCAYQRAIHRSCELIQINLADTLSKKLKTLSVDDLKKMEGFFTALFYILDRYKTPFLYQLNTLRGHNTYLKYLLNLYIKHSVYDLFILLPPSCQNFLTQLSHDPNNILYRSIAEHLQVRLTDSPFLASWYTSNWRWHNKKNIKRDDYSLLDLLDILFQRKEGDSEIWFLDDHSGQFDCNYDDVPQENKRLLIEIRSLPNINDFDNQTESYMYDLIEMAGYLSPYNTPQHLFESKMKAQTKLQHRLLFKSA